MTKIQFYAIELARNRQGHNDQIRFNFKPKKRSQKKLQKNEAADDDAHHQLTKEVELELQNILTGNHVTLLK